MGHEFVANHLFIVMLCIRWWAIKIGLILGLIIAGFFIPNGFFYGWTIVGIIGAGLFILVQLLVCIYA